MLKGSRCPGLLREGGFFSETTFNIKTAHG
jgi:hypothetical protein